MFDLSLRHVLSQRCLANGGHKVRSERNFFSTSMFSYSLLALACGKSFTLRFTTAGGADALAVAVFLSIRSFSKPADAANSQTSQKT